MSRLGVRHDQEEWVQRLAALPGWYRENTTLAWVCVLIAVNQLGYGSIVPIVPLYAKTFGVSQFLIGLAVAVYGLARFVANVPSGRVAESLGRNWAIAIGGIITTAGNLLSATAGSYWLFLGGRFIGGLGAATVITATQIIVADLSNTENRGRVMGIYMTAFMFAVGFAPLPGGFIGQYFGLAVPFYVYGLFGLVVSLIALTRIPDTRGLAPTPAHARTASHPQFGAQIAILLRNPAFLLVSVASFSTYFARTGGVFTIVPQRAQDTMGLSTSQIGLGLSVISVVSIAIAYPSGVVIDRFGRKAIIVPAILFGAAAMFFFALSGNLIWYITSCLIWGVSVGFAGTAPTAYAADAAPPGMNAAALGTFRTLSDAGYFFGPFLLGATADLAGTRTALLSTAALLLVVGIGFALIAPETHRVKQAVVVAKDATVR